MKFPHAYNGVKNIYTAVFLQLLSAIAFACMSMIVSVGQVRDAAESVAAVAGVLMIAGVVAGFVSFILNVKGTIDASQDEPVFRKALIWLCVGIIGSVAASVFQSSNTLLSSLAAVIGNIGDLLAVYYILTGIISLAKHMLDQAVGDLAKKAINRFITAQIISIAAAIGAIFTIAGVQDQTTLGLIGIAVTLLALASLIFELIAFIVYLKTLSSAKRMLAEK